MSTQLLVTAYNMDILILWASSWPGAAAPEGENSAYLALMFHLEPVSAYTVGV